MRDLEWVQAILNIWLLLAVARLDYRVSRLEKRVAPYESDSPL